MRKDLSYFGKLGQKGIDAIIANAYPHGANLGESSYALPGFRDQTTTYKDLASLHHNLYGLQIPATAPKRWDGAGIVAEVERVTAGQVELDENCVGVSNAQKLPLRIPLGGEVALLSGFSLDFEKAFCSFRLDKGGWYAEDCTRASLLAARYVARI